MARAAGRWGGGQPTSTLRVTSAFLDLVNLPVTSTGIAWTCWAAAGSPVGACDFVGLRGSAGLGKVPRGDYFS